jgi:microcystin-dependent protein
LNATSSAGNQIIPGAAMLGAAAATDPIYGNPSSLVAMDPTSVSNTGGSQAHLNMQPFLVLTFCIALQGIFPSRN